jgi:hypothetical protein
MSTPADSGPSDRLDPRAAFPRFYANTAIQALAREFRWTVSGQIGEDDPEDPSKRATRKAPIDLRHLLDGGGLRGAWALDDTCLVSLGELTDRFPLAANAAFYLRARTDGLMVIDIEPKCPADVAAGILSLPGIVYSELSMSGNGYHLIAPLPRNFHDFPAATGKKVLKQNDGWYEVLLEHWVTFTRQPVPAARRARPAGSTATFEDVADLYSSLASLATDTAAVSAAAVAVELSATMPQIPDSTKIIDHVLSKSTPALRTLEDFANDHSRWEFSVLSRLYTRMLPELSTYGQKNSTTYTDSDRAWLLYTAALEMIPTRHKHLERRNGRPFLLDRAAALIAERKHRVNDRRHQRGPAF